LLFKHLQQLQQKHMHVQPPTKHTAAMEMRMMASCTGTAQEGGVWVREKGLRVPAARQGKKKAEQRQLELLKSLKIELVVLARYMQVLSADFLKPLFLSRRSPRQA
jgi:formyltetrahydrofolate hydrolase